GADAVSVMLLHRGGREIEIAGATNEVAGQADRLQLETGEGPCLDAARADGTGSAQLAEELPDVADEQVGASMAATWPPRSNSDQCTTVCSRSIVHRIDTSMGNTATPVGTVERSPSSCPRCLRCSRGRLRAGCLADGRCRRGGCHGGQLPREAAV
ncbi:MAG TPA: hypothetical protein VFB74_36050, partial [Kribbellaceae bacterium]|nr:hypothetical protein [Kribbellaceae bacterium]